MGPISPSSFLPPYFTREPKKGENLPLREVVERAFFLLKYVKAEEGDPSLSPGIDRERAYDLLEPMRNQITEAALKALEGSSPPISRTETLCHLLFSLSEKLDKEQLIPIYHSLDPEDRVKLAELTGLVEGDIAADPSILLSYRNGRGESVLASLIELRHREGLINKELLALQSDFGKISESPLFPFFCYLVWWCDGGKDDPGFEDPEYGKRKLQENPALIRDLLGRVPHDELLLQGSFIKDSSAEEVSPSADSRGMIDVRIIRGFLAYEFDGKFLAQLANKIGCPLFTLELAKSLGRRREVKLLDFIRGFDSPSEELKGELAEICAAAFVDDISYISVLGITNTEMINKILRISAENSPQTAIRIVEMLGIRDPKILVEISKICAKITPKDGENYAGEVEIPPAALCIQSFGINDPEALFEIAKISAEHRPLSTGKYFDSFLITDPSQKVEIAKICLTKAARFLPYMFAGIGITDEKTIGEIILWLFPINPNKASDLLKACAITDQNQLLKVFETGLYFNPHLINNCLDKFLLIEERNRVEILKTQARKYTIGAFEFYIKKCRITDKSALHELAEICALKGAGKDFYPGILSEVFQITDPVIVEKICLSCDLDIYTSLHKEELAEVLTRNYGSIFTKEILEGNLRTLLKEGDLAPFLDEEIPPLFALIVLFMAKAKKANPELDITLPFILALYKASQYGDPLLRKELLRGALLHFDKESFRNHLEGFIKGRDGRPLAPLGSLATIISFFCNEEVTIPEETLYPRLLKIRDSIWAHRLELKSLKSGLEKSLISMIDTLKKSDLPFETKLHILERCVTLGIENATALRKCAEIIVIVIKLTEPSPHQFDPRLVGDFTVKDLEAMIGEVIREKLFPLDSDQLPLYLALSEKQRYPFAFETYASRIEDPLAKTEMTRFIQSLLKGTFHAERYKTEGNPHATALSSWHKEGSDKSVWQMWQHLPGPVSLVPNRAAAAGAGSASEIPVAREGPFDLRSWMIETFFVKKLAGELSFSASLLTESPRVTHGKNRLEQILMSLFDAKTSKEQKNFLKMLAEEVSKDPKLSPALNEEIHNIIKDLDQKRFVVKITDDPEDLFLSGTEIVGSCQGISADPSKNKALLGTCMDGKIQIVEIKDEASEKMVARSFLKLLFHEGKPVLLLERFYPFNISPEFKNALLSMARERAKELGIDLHVGGQVYVYEGPVLKSLGSPSPWEYVDSSLVVGNNYCTKGVYEIYAKKDVL